MAELSQIQKTIEDSVIFLESCTPEQLNEKCKYLFELVLPPKSTVQKDETKAKDEPKTTKAVESAVTHLNPALVQKSLDSHYDRLMKIYDRSKNRDLGLVLARLLMVFHQDESLPQNMSVLMCKIGPEAYKIWGTDFTRNACIYLAQHYRAHKDLEILPNIHAALEYLMRFEHHVEVLDCILETNQLDLIIPYVTDKLQLKFFHYIQQNLFYSSDPENYKNQMRVLFQLYKAQYPFTALSIALEFTDKEMVKQVYEVIQQKEQEEQMQFCLILAQHQNLQSDFFMGDKILQNVLKNNHQSSIYLKAVQKLNLVPPKQVDDIMKRKDIEIDWAKFNSYAGNYFLNAFVHIGYQDDYMFNSDILRESQDAEKAVSESQILTAQAEIQQNNLPQQLPEGHNLFITSKFDAQKTDISTAIAAGSLGIVNMWAGYAKNFEFMQRYANSPDKWIRAGAMLGYGLSAHGCKPDTFDFLINLLGGQFNPYMDQVVEPVTVKNLPNQYASSVSNSSVNDKVARNNSTIEYTNCKEALCALSLGIAYMGTNNEKAKNIFIQRLKQSSSDIQNDIPLLEKNPRCYACLALGLICAGSGDLEVADIILRVMAGNSRSQRVLRFFPLCVIGLGLIFMHVAKEKDGEKKVEEYCSQIFEKLTAVTKPDSQQEKLAVTAPEDNTQLAAYLQTLITIFAYANQGNIQVIQDLMQAMTDSIQGRVAAEEAVNISKFDKDQQLGNKQNEIKDYVAETGQPLLLPSSDRNIWPGDNMDPATLFVIGLGLLTGDDQITNQMVSRFAERILKFANINAQRAVPFLLALTSLSNPKPELVDDLSKLALHTDKTISFNALIALGLIGCGTQNFKIAGVLRHSIESKCYSEDNIEHVILGAQLAFGLLNAGKGAVGLSKNSLTQITSLATVLMFTGPSAEVMLRPKCQPIFYLLACAMKPKFRSAVDKNGQDVQVKVRAGRAIEELSGEKPFRLAGFALHEMPIVTGLEDQVVIVDEKWKSTYESIRGIGDVNVVVVKPEVQESTKENAGEAMKVEELYT
ncbi:26S_proteasome non-ATPase regulatory subunit 2 [Hexamita inflata]|uniref:26S proteasome non-ATPase regulatory subunit 2 n=1 Tax=Hexamita inflata TaxID=28002 RepID=A0AA86QK96_9EUKA|nr:26S proteasome non-ATPase regulatory subunit 2 [Hexamita inflata]